MIASIARESNSLGKLKPGADCLILHEMAAVNLGKLYSYSSNTTPQPEIGASEDLYSWCLI